MSGVSLGSSRFRRVFAVFVVIFLFSFASLFHFHQRRARRIAKNYPPLYEDLAKAELSLPQHDAFLPAPEGRNGRFVRFENQMWGVGFNNQLFEMYA